ncbi:MAG TPA: hypothetical protein VEY88_19460 [Archangium sp.]|nr:hypothetical protein [Archangium sp.]
MGSVIAATTATTLTRVFGEAYITVLSKLMEARAGELPTAEEVAEALRKGIVGRRATA